MVANFLVLENIGSYGPFSHIARQLIGDESGAINQWSALLVSLVRLVKTQAEA